MSLSLHLHPEAVSVPKEKAGIINENIVELPKILYSSSKLMHIGNVAKMLCHLDDVKLNSFQN